MPRASYWKKHKVRLGKLNKIYNKKHKAEISVVNKKRCKKWYQKNKKSVTKKSMAYNRLPKRREHDRQNRHDLKVAAIKHYGGRCKCCKIVGIDFMTVDHIDGGGTKHRKKSKAFRANPWKWLKKYKYPKRFQILCWNCNWSKHSGHGICLHKRR